MGKSNAHTFPKAKDARSPPKMYMESPTPTMVWLYRGGGGALVATGSHFRGYSTLATGVSEAPIAAARPLNLR